MPDLADVLRLAVAGVFPPADGGWDRVAPWRDGTEAVLALTGHAYLAVGGDIDDAVLTALRPDGFGGAHHPAVMARLAGAGWVDALDVVLGATGGRPAPGAGSDTGPAAGHAVGPHAVGPLVVGPLVVEREDLAGHPRVAYARRLRDDVRVVGRPDRSDGSLVTVSRGLAGLTELGIEATTGTDGSRLLTDVVAALPADEPVLVAVAPGNARALRSILRAGFRPLGSVQVYEPDR